MRIKDLMDLFGMGCGDAVTSEVIPLGIHLEVRKGTGGTFDALHEVGNTTGFLMTWVKLDTPELHIVCGRRYAMCAKRFVDSVAIMGSYLTIFSGSK